MDTHIVTHSQHAVASGKAGGFAPDSYGRKENTIVLVQEVFAAMAILFRMFDILRRFDVWIVIGKRGADFIAKFV